MYLPYYLFIRRRIWGKFGKWRVYSEKRKSEKEKIEFSGEEILNRVKRLTKRFAFRIVREWPWDYNDEQRIVLGHCILENTLDDI